MWRLGLPTLVSVSKDPTQNLRSDKVPENFRYEARHAATLTTLQRVAALHSVHSADMLGADLPSTRLVLLTKRDLFFHRQLECSSKSARPTSY